MLKLRGAEIPKALPQNLLMQLASPQVAAAPIVPPAYAPMIPPPMAAPAYAPMMPPPMAAPVQAPMIPPPMVAAQPPMVAAMPIGVAHPQQMMQQQQAPLVPGLQQMVQQPVFVQQAPPEIVPMQMMSPPVVPAQMPMVQQQQPEMLVNKQRSASVASVDLGASLDWAVPHQSKLRYTQVFNTNDRTRCGHLTGSQARNILIQWGIPQAALAKIW